MRREATLRVGYSVDQHPPTEDQWAAIIKAGARMSNFFEHVNDDVKAPTVELIHDA